MMKDIYSRKLVVNEVHENESSEHASLLLSCGCLREQTAGRPLVLHSDNGAAMKGATMLATMYELGVVPSFSRPRVSNDNAYAEALFRTANIARSGLNDHSIPWTKPCSGCSASSTGTTSSIVIVA